MRYENSFANCHLSHLTYHRAILIRVASVGYARDPDFEVAAPNQPTMIERVDFALHNNAKFIMAAEAERTATSSNNPVARSQRDSRRPTKRGIWRSHL